MEFVAAGAVAFFFDDAAGCDAVFYAGDDEAGTEEVYEFVAVFDGFREVVPGVYMEEGEGHAGGVEGLAGEPCHDDGVLAAAKEEGGGAELGGGFAEDVDGLALELLEMADGVFMKRHGVLGWLVLDLKVLGWAESGGEVVGEHLQALFFCVGLSVEDDVCFCGFFEAAVTAGEFFYGTGFCFGIEAFDVALLAGFEGGFDVDFNEVVLADDLAGHATEGLGGGDEGTNGDDAGVGKEAGDFCGAAEVFAAVFIREAESAGEAGAELVAIEDSGEAAFVMQGALEGGSEGAFS